MINFLEIIKEKDLNTIANVVIAYSTFIGVLSAIVYYIADIKGFSILITQGIVIIYILVFFIIILFTLKIIKKEQKNEN